MSAKQILPNTQGFSLIELGIVLAVIALLAGGLISSLGTQRELAAAREAQRQLDNARETILAFAMTQGRLPCPARPTLPETAADAGREDCTLSHGVLPWSSLGLSQNDPWGQRLSYYAHPLFTAPVPAGALASFNLGTEGNANIKESASAGNDIASALPAVIVCHGAANAGAYLPSGQQSGTPTGDEAENANADLTFIAHPRTPLFDDQLIWLSASLLKARLVAVGRLP